MKFRSLFALAALAGAGFALGQSTTNPVGYVTIECKANSDTIVGVPLRQSAAFVGTLNGAPDTNTDPTGYAILTLDGTPALTVDAFANTHYVKFKNTEPTPAAGDGQWFVIDSNTADTITVNLNGGSIAAVDGAALEVIKFWTLDELFDPAQSTNSAATTGNAIVTSLGTGLSPRRTTILIPDLSGVGTNLAPTQIFYIHENTGDLTKTWRNSTASTVDAGSYQFWPDSYFIVRHPASVTASTMYTSTGEVDLNDFSYGLATRAVGSQDNFIGMPRPVDVELGDLNLAGTAAFLTSTGTGISGRRDQLLVFDNQIALRNKAPSVIYYYHGGKWLKPGDTVDSPTRAAEVIPAGSGFVIRKYQTGTGATASWNNTTPY